MKLIDVLLTVHDLDVLLTVNDLDVLLTVHDLRWGTAQYGFNAEGSDEVSITTGERLKVLTDMGDWYHVLNSAGARCVSIGGHM
jgi:hypothetical protein